MRFLPHRFGAPVLGLALLSLASPAASEQRILPETPRGSMDFGSAVARYADWAVVGAPHDHWTFQGSARVLRRVDGLWMDRENVDRMVSKLLGWDFDQRVANACIGADRADLVLAGCAILEAIRRVWPSERLRVADRGLREGILSELMADEGVWRRNWRPEGRA